MQEPPAPPVGLYIHVPFCRALCSYCAFSKELYREPRADRWLEGLERERERRASWWGERLRLDSVFLGGGTPSALTPDQWRRLGSVLADGFELVPDAEVTAEANPESLTPAIVAAMRAAGVNRISLGMQSADQQELQLLERAHGTAEVVRAVGAARGGGIDSVNIDLMYGLPGQDPGVFAGTLAATLELAPDHLSAYCLGLEPGTPLADRVDAGAVPRPQDDPARTMFDGLGRTLGGAGFEHYEISNWARPGAACRHNLKYWRREDVIALGPSAHGFFRDRRWANPAGLDGWLAAYEGGPEPRAKEIPEATARFEWLFLNLRLTAGFRRAAYASRWGEPVEAAYGGTLDRLERDGLIERDGTTVRLAPQAWFLSDGVFAEFAP